MGIISPVFFSGKIKSRGGIYTKNIKRLLASFMVLLGIVGIGMVEIVAANPDPCPDAGSGLWNTAGSGPVLVVTTGTNPVTYYVIPPAGPAGNGVQEVCVKSDVAPVSASIIQASWQADLLPNNPPFEQVQFIRLDGEPNNIPYDGGTHTVGSATWSANPTNTKILVHIKDPSVCGSAITCFRTPGGPQPPVPELSPAILTPVGLLGLVLLSKRYKKH